MPYMISLMSVGFFFELKKEKKDANSEHGLCQSKYTRKGGAEQAVAAAGLFIKQWFQALPAVIMVWNYFLFFMSFIHTFKTYITSLSLESVTPPWITTSHGIFCSLLSPASRLFSWNLSGYQPLLMPLPKQAFREAATVLFQTPSFSKAQNTT